MTIEEIINSFTNENGFSWGIDTAMRSLRPNCLYSLVSKNGNFELTHWEENQYDAVNDVYIDPPTSQEIRDEYIRQQTIAECIEYFKQNRE